MGLFLAVPRLQLSRARFDTRRIVHEHLLSQNVQRKNHPIHECQHKESERDGPTHERSVIRKGKHRSGVDRDVAKSRIYMTQRS